MTDLTTTIEPGPRWACQLVTSHLDGNISVKYLNRSKQALKTMDFTPRQSKFNHERGQRTVPGYLEIAFVPAWRPSMHARHFAQAPVPPLLLELRSPEVRPQPPCATALRAWKPPKFRRNQYQDLLVSFKAWLCPGLLLAV
jgi:hypothetical protein